MLHLTPWARTKTTQEREAENIVQSQALSYNQGPNNIIYDVGVLQLECQLYYLPPKSSHKGPQNINVLSKEITSSALSYSPVEKRCWVI